MKQSLANDQKRQVYAQVKTANFVESMRLEGYQVDTSLLDLSAAERKQKKAAILSQYGK